MLVHEEADYIEGPCARQLISPLFEVLNQQRQKLRQFFLGRSKRLAPPVKIVENFAVRLILFICADEFRRELS